MTKLIKKIITIFFIIIFIIFVYWYFYLFVFYIQLENRSIIDVVDFSCQSTSGERWRFGSVRANETIHRLLTPTRGVAVECKVETVDLIKSALVVGYFDEGSEDTKLIIVDRRERFDIEIKDYCFFEC